MISKSQFVIFSALLASQGLMVEGMFNDNEWTVKNNADYVSSSHKEVAKAAAEAKAAANKAALEMKEKVKTSMAAAEAYANDTKSTDSAAVDAAAEAQKASLEAARSQALAAEKEKTAFELSKAAETVTKHTHLTEAIKYFNAAFLVLEEAAKKAKELATAKDSELAKALSAHQEAEKNLADAMALTDANDRRAKLAEFAPVAKKAKEDYDQATKAATDAHAALTKADKAVADNKQELDTKKAELAALEAAAKKAKDLMAANGKLTNWLKRSTEVLVPTPDATATAEPVPEPEAPAVTETAAANVKFADLPKDFDIKKSVDELVKKVHGDKPSDQKAADADSKFVAETFNFPKRARAVEDAMNKIIEAEKKAAEEAEKKAAEEKNKKEEGKKLRRLAGEENKTAAKPVDHVSSVIKETVTEALSSLAQLQSTYGETYQQVTDKATYTAFKTDAEKTGAAISRAEAVIKLRDENKSKTAELKNDKATILGLGLGLGLGIPALAAVVFTVLVKTNRVLLNFGSTASADV